MAATTFGPAARRGRDAPERRIAALQHRELAQLAPEGKRVLAVELVDLAVGLEVLLQPAVAIGDRLGEVLEPQRGHGLALPRAAPRARAGRPGRAAGARRPTPRRASPWPSHSTSTAISSGSPSRISVPVSSGIGCDLEGHLAHDRQRAPAAGRPRHRSSPVTFFITRPPDLKTSPRR